MENDCEVKVPMMMVLQSAPIEGMEVSSERHSQFWLDQCQDLQGCEVATIHNPPPTASHCDSLQLLTKLSSPNQFAHFVSRMRYYNSG
jgi:hypothetical protein